ncbi:probable pectinesterase/pectinesterase inhibitor 46 [Phtheirospermum japonicum]|uniref:Pectinesterase n=1 Tax=Phtheirospermum japonicum TaxID=374723 RepID=A0A830BJH0_9LAMI|nr:probable pectinesterase/pectinesterase inhibitor 46 [Phtheirospermum japonicum]
MIFQNTATKSQAVALLSSSDRSVFYQCLMDSKQDTLYVHSKRQFYRECYILGTVDFIFGNAAVVIQTSLILPKNPFPGKTNVITAQGKNESNHNTGLSIQNCTIIAAEDLTGVRTFLGRPWRNFSTTVIMQSRMDGSIDPEGWLPMNDEPPPSTIFYAEYNNVGKLTFVCYEIKF